MKHLLIAAAIICAVAACNSAGTNTNTDSTATTGDTSSTAMSKSTSDTAWTLLFDGKSLAGWHTYGMSAPGSGWSIDSSAIHYRPVKSKDEGARTGDLLTNDEYSNFDLKLEWKISKNGNSGILFYVNEDTAKYKETFYTGPEMQVLDNAGHPDAKIIKHRAGDLYDLITSKPETVKPAGEWNAVEIKSMNGNLTFFLNGTQTLSTTMWDDNWKKLIAGSKFKDMPGFGTFKQGHIALQDHGNEVWYKNIEIKKL